ncbi:hypothetical protein N7462_005699 [Penicillium macrosclerotiorum]|uniref:uncharacterized protein n=1 Tax=Penicillium macrosclerotiorum TaxID=303699 RepID=UPI002547DCD1|nr:uncharacterized protein N7462_005699 [Penicillium macrosclerotiorum]KAJ5682534.1 hypothetical protein N7462_005699 [Penicillium macrosclerotiorum]
MVLKLFYHKSGKVYRGGEESEAQRSIGEVRNEGSLMLFSNMNNRGYQANTCEILPSTNPTQIHLTYTSPDGSQKTITMRNRMFVFDRKTYQWGSTVVDGILDLKDMARLGDGPIAAFKPWGANGCELLNVHVNNAEFEVVAMMTAFVLSKQLGTRPMGRVRNTSPPRPGA